MSIRIRSRRFAAAIAALLAGAAAISIATIAVGNSAKVSAATIGPAPAVTSHYAVFERAGTSTDALPALSSAEPQVPEGTVTRRLAPSGSAEEWATLEGAKLCVVVRFTPAGSHHPGGSEACNSGTYLESTNQLLVQASLASSSSTPPSRGLANVISGLAPDGVGSVTLNFTDGTQQTVPVEENGFVDVLSSPKGLEDVTWVNSAGKTTTGQ